MCRMLVNLTLSKCGDVLMVQTKLEDEQRTSAYYEVTGEKDSEEHHTPRKIKDFDVVHPTSYLRFTLLKKHYY